MPMNPYGNIPLRGQYDYDNTGLQTKYTQLDSAIDAAQAGWYTGLGGVASSMGADAAKAWALKNAQENYAEAGQYTPTGPQRIEDVSGPGEFFDWAGNKIVENVPQMAATITGTGLGAVVGGVPGAVIGGAAASVPSHLGEAYGKQQEVGIDDPMAMYGAAGINTALEFLPSGAFVGALRRTAVKEMGGGTLARAVGSNVATEAITEPAQGAVIEASVGNMPEFSLQTPEQKAYWMDRMNEAAAGGVVGGVMGGGAHIASYPGQAMAQASELPGQVYDTVTDTATGAMNRMRGVTPEERAEQDAQKAQQREQFGFMGQSTDPAFMEKKANMTTHLQNKREQGIPFELWEQEVFENLPIEDRRSIMEEANIIKDTSVESTTDIVIDEDMRAELDKIAYAMADGTLTPADEQIISDMVINEEITQEEYQYIEAMAAEYVRNADKVIPDEEEINYFDTLADDTTPTDIETFEGLKSQFTQTEAENPNPDFQFQQGEGIEGDFQDRPEATIQDQYEQMAGKKFIGTGKINIRSKADFKTGFKKRYDEVDYITVPENIQAISGKNYDNERLDKTKQLQQEELAKYNTSTKNEYRYIPLNEALEKEAIRDMMGDDLKENIDEGLKPSESIAFHHLIIARKKEAAEDIMARSNKAGTVYETRKAFMDAQDYSGLLDLYQAIEATPKGIIDDQGVFDYADQQQMEVPRVISSDASKDTSSIEQGFIPLSSGKALNLVKALPKRMHQLEKMGYTSITPDEIYSHADEGAVTTEEMQDLKRDALVSLMSEYADKLGNQMVTERDVINTSEFKGMSEAQKDKFIQEARQLNINYKTEKGKRVPGEYSFPSNRAKGVELNAIPARSMDKGFIPIRAKARAKDQTPKVLDLNAATTIMDMELKQKGIKSSRAEALKAVLANYSSRFGDIPGDPVTLDDVIKRAGAVLNWKKPAVDKAGKPIGKSTFTRTTGEDLLATTEANKRAARTRSLDARVEELRTDNIRLKETISLDPMLQSTADTLTMGEKSEWITNERRRKEFYNKLDANERALKVAAKEQRENEALNIRQDRKGKGEMSDFERGRTEVTSALNAVVGTWVPALQKELTLGDINSRLNQLHIFRKSNKEMRDAPYYTEEEMETLTAMGIDGAVIDAAEYKFESIIDAIDYVRTQFDTGTFDSWEIEQTEVAEIGGDAIPKQRDIGYELGEKGVTRPGFSSAEKAAMDLQQRTPVEKGAKDDVSTVSIPDEKTSTQRILDREQEAARLAAERESKEREQAPELSKEEQANILRQEQSIDERQNAIDAAQSQIESELMKDASYRGISKKLESFKKQIPKQDYARVARKDTKVEKLDETSITKKVQNFSRMLDTRLVKLYASNQKIKDLVARIEKLEKDKTKFEGMITESPERKVKKEKTKAIESAQEKRDAQAKAEAIAEKTKPKVGDVIGKIPAGSKQPIKTPEKTAPLLSEDEASMFGSIYHRTDTSIHKEDKYTGKKTGAAIRDTAKFAGETIPLAYVFKPAGIEQSLLIHKAPGTNTWMVSIPGTNITLTENNKTKKLALADAIKRINETGIQETNTLIKEASDAGKKLGEVSDLFAIPTEAQGVKDPGYLKATKKYNASLSEPLTVHGFSISSPTVKATQIIADKMLKGTGIIARIVDGVEAEKVAERLGIDDYKLGMMFGSLHGFAENTPNKDGSYNVYINPAMQGKLREEILAHEIGHVTMYGSIIDAKTTSKEAQAVLNQFGDWLNKYGKDDTLYRKLVESKKSPEAALLYLKSGFGEFHMGVLGKETSAYMRDFDEWYADEAGKALLRKLKQQSPRGFVQKYFTKLVEMLRRVFKKTSEVEKFLMQLSEQTKPQYALSREPMSKNLSTAQTKLNKAVSKQYNTSMTQILKDVFLDKDWNLRNFGIPALTELADMMHKKRGDKTVDDSYWSAKLAHMAKYDEHVTTIMRGATKEQQRQIMNELYDENLSDSKVSGRTKRIRSLFRDLENYLKSAGIELKVRKNYFPEIADVEYVEKHEEQFKAMMARYPSEMAGISKKWNDDIKKRDHHLRRVTDPETLLKPEDVPQAIYDNIVKTEGVFDEAAVGQQTPNIRFLNHRIVSFLKGRDKFDWENSYLQSSVTDATAAYITQAVKRVEYEKRFGQLDNVEQDAYVDYLEDKGGRTVYSQEEIKQFKRAAQLTNKFEWLLKRAQDQGASANQLQKARTYLAAEMGTLGRHTALWLNERLGVPMPPAHSPINKTLQTGISTLMSLANVWVLGMSTLTSLADPIGIAVRTGSLGQAFSSFKVGMSANFSSNRTELRILAEAVGSISDIATKEALAHGYNMAYMTPAVKRMNDWFFHAIGLEQWTQSTRLMAVDAAQGFLKRHDPANNTGNKHSVRFLKELGLKEGDIKYGVDGKVRVLSYEQYQNATREEQRSDDRLKLAIAEFVDEAILRPNPSQRPAWASDPHYALAFHLKSFMYAFQKTILNPLVHEAKNGNYMPLLSMAAYIPAMMAVGLTKDMLKTLGDDDDDWTPTYKENWDMFDYMWDGAEKGGLFGIAQPIFDIRRDMRYGGSGIGAMYSPGLDVDTFTQLPVPFNYSYRNLFDG